VTTDQFVFWLKSYFEIFQHFDGEKTLNEKQVQEIKNHLDLVLIKVDPIITQEPQKSLDKQLPLFLPSHFSKVVE
jgi:hypothetical protein